MKVEIVEFYPFKSKKPDHFTGSMHVYLCDLGIDLRDIFVVKHKKGKLWKFFLPCHVRTDETGKPIRFSVFTFTDQKKNKDLIDSIIKEGNKYMIEFVKKNGLTRLSY